MKKRNIMKTLFAGTMTLGMALSVSPAFAVDNETNIEAYLVKELNIEDGINYTKTFDFKFDLIKNGTAAVTGDTGDKTISIEISSNDSDHKVAKNIFGDGGLEYNAAGIYTYNVEETTQDAPDLDDPNYGLKCSDAKYELVVWVKNKTDKSGVYVEKVQVTQIQTDDGTETVGGSNKVNPDPTPDEGDGSDSEFKFVNTYTKKAGSEDPSHPGHYLATTISKDVEGDYADLTKDFDFNVYINLPDTYIGEGQFDGIIFESEEKVSEENKIDYILNGSTPTPIKLSDNQELRIYDLPAGTTYYVEEIGASNYTPSVVVKEKNLTTVDKNGNKNMNLDSKDDGGKLNLITENGNSIAFTNTYDDTSITPTGIIINNLPFVLMVVVAGSGLALYVVSKRRSHQ
ncbi:hypothetical protein KEC48_16060 [Clostridium sp. C1]|uniref:DUF7601 domain-containing protein n=1 Tax=Clostridium sp. C1 TaxID=1155388 RepID=UPI001BA46A0F|nr:hypothetical protein [Clostridium sp. C1]QUN12954.1 hypothetical protein KEC48_16060 [Clostridium sp. C1]